MKPELPVEKLRLVSSTDLFGCTSSGELGKLETIIGQERAVRAMRFGLGIKGKGFNIFISGVPGSGRTTMTRRFLEEIATSQPVPSDWCYINNFQDSYHPRVLRLPAGKAIIFQRDLENLVKMASNEIRNAFESEDYANHRDQTVKNLQQQKVDILEQVNQLARQEGFVLQSSPMGVMTIPIRNGKPLTEEEFLALSQEEKDKITASQQKVQDALDSGLRQTRMVDKNVRDALQKLDRQVALYAINPLIEDIKEKFPDIPQVIEHIDHVCDDILDNLSQFKAEPEEQTPSPLPRAAIKEASFKKYRVNVLVNNATLSGAPVILETNPTYSNLFGRIDQEAQFGTLVTDFTLIRGGSLHQANGGYLVLPAEEVLRNPFSWDSLKRALETQEITIESAAEKIGFATKSLQPESIPLDVKVVLIGQPSLYQLLLAYDEQFSELFKVKADFDTQMQRTEDNIRDYAAFVCTLCETEGLKHLDNLALGQVIEHGSRLAEDQEKLSTHFGVLADVIRESNYYASSENTPYISDTHILKAIEERFYRSSLIQERVHEMIAKNVIKINVSGEEVGQVNGLSVISLGDIAFGQPSRITVSISLGREGVIDIEREAKLGGPIHTKGVLILSGYLAEKYAQDKPLSLSARLVFEQSYSGVEGDSASSTELYAILSALSGVPIKQGIAVTGSVNQKGQVQAIGGVNEKVEGFFEICQAKGLTGDQGVMIPESNVTNLMLKEAVLEAVRQGKFHIWAVETIDQGIEILTGVKAGQRLEDGSFEPESINARVDQCLRDMAEKLAQFGKEEKKPSDSNS